MTSSRNIEACLIHIAAGTAEGRPPDTHPHTFDATSAFAVIEHVRNVETFFPQRPIACSNLAAFSGFSAASAMSPWQSSDARLS